MASMARGQGMRVLGGGRVPLGEEGLPFAPVIEALRGLAIWTPTSFRRSRARPAPS
jgi:hypothetical protein